MCGRYTLKVEGQEIAERFGLAETPELVPRYNIAPTQQVPVVLEEPAGGGRTLRMVHWGLIPSWADDPSIEARMINARAETVADKPSFRRAFERRRCLVVADGFYEWKKTESGKQPYYFRLEDSSPFGFAGLWETWSPGGRDGGEELRSATIITTEANGLAAEVHDRMPVILPPEHYGAWLDSDNDGRELLAMLAPASAPASPLASPLTSEMEAYPVSRRVNRPANDEPSVIEPV